MSDQKELYERRQTIAACHSAISRRETFLSLIAGAADLNDASALIAREFGLSDNQVETVLNLQARHFTTTYLERFQEQLTALDELINDQ